MVEKSQNFKNTASPKNNPRFQPEIRQCDFLLLLCTLVFFHAGRNWIDSSVRAMDHIYDNNVKEDGFSTGSGISVDIILLTPFNMILFLNHTKTCAWGKPLLGHSIVYIQHWTWSNMGNFSIDFMNCMSFLRNTPIIKSWL